MALEAPTLLPDGRWRISVAADVDRLLRDDRCVPAPNATLVDFGVDWMLHHHGELHAAERRAFRGPFSPKAVAQHGDRVTAVVDGVLDRLTDGPTDLLAEYAFPIPMGVVAALLGLDGLDPWEVHERWDDMMSTYGDHDDDARSTAAASTNQLLSIIEAAVEAQPDGSLTAQMARAGEAANLPPEVVAADLLLVLGAGFDTTMALIANTLGELLERDDRLAIVADSLALGRFVEEVLRTQPSVQWVGRVTAEDIVVGDITIPAGARLVLSIADANRDRTRFVDAEQFDLDRSPNPHLAFGAGPHFCLGAHLGRLEATTAVARLVERFPRTHLVGAVEWREHALLRCPTAVPAMLAR